ncbi:hypothetical protein HYU23_04360 [Candidatus Woesearchaeota archaeon]|nr:hypothetical protein [Candidatus Woesearchaeota archaeon]
MKKIFLVLVLITIFLVSCTKNVQHSNISENSNEKQNKTLLVKKTINDKFIVVNPFDLSQVSSISKFRSCVGHDYSGYNSNKEIETQRSMKHYLNGISSAVGYNNKIKVYAPFDGKISYIDDDFASFEGNQRGQQIWISGSSAGDWVFVFFHIDLLQSIKRNTEVKSGQHIGYANLDNSPNFDIVLKKFGIFGRNTIESPFMHMSLDVINQYKGLNLDDFIISKSVRDSKPCPCTGEYCSFPSNSPENNPEDWVVIDN